MAQYSLVNIGPGYGLVPRRHQAITWTNIDLVSVTSHGIQLRQIFLGIYKVSVTRLSLKNIF